MSMVRRSFLIAGPLTAKKTLESWFRLNLFERELVFVLVLWFYGNVEVRR